MKQAFTCIATLLRRTALTLLILLFVLPALGAIAWFSGRGWLTSDSGEAWLQETLSTETQQIAISGLQIEGFATLRFKQLSISNEEGVIVQAEKMLAELDIAAIVSGRLKGKLEAAFISLEQLPERGESAQKGESSSLAGYIASADVSLRIDELRLSEAIIPGGGVSAEVYGAVEGELNNMQGNVKVSGRYKKETLRLSAPFSWQGDVLSIHDLQGKSSDFTLFGSLDYRLKSKLVDGRLSAKISDLNVLSLFLSETRLSGSANLQVRLKAEAGKQAVSAGLEMDSLAVDAFFVKSASAELQTDNLYDISTINAEITASALEMGETTIKVVDASIAPDENGFTLTAGMEGRNKRPFSVDLKLDIPVLTPLTLNIREATLTSSNAVMTLSGELEDKRLDIALEGSSLELSELPFVTLEGVDLMIPTLSGSIDGSLEKPLAELNFSLKSSDNPLGALAAISAQYDGQQLSADFQLEGKGIEDARGDASLPFSLSLQPFESTISGDTPLTGSAKIDANLTVLAEMFLKETLVLAGDLNAGITLDGRVGQPRLTGELTLADGRFIDKVNAIELVNIEASAMMRGDQIELKSLTANSRNNQGVLSASGGISFRDNKRLAADLALRMDRVHLLKNEHYDAVLNADLALNTTDTGYALSGTVSPEELRIRLPERFSSSIPELNIVRDDTPDAAEEETALPLALDVTFKADNRIFISGWGLDAELAGVLDVKGTIEEPLIYGNLNTVRGRFRELGRQFTLDKTTLRFQGAVPPSPYFDVAAVTEVNDVKAKVLITGNANKPKVGFASVPSMPEDEVLSLILFGTDLQEISPFQALQLADTVRRFSGSGGTRFNPLQNLQDATGLDDIRLEKGESGGATVGAGKYISDKVYLQVEQGTETGSGNVSVEVEVTPKVVIESKATKRGESQIGIFREWEY